MRVRKKDRGKECANEKNKKSKGRGTVGNTHEEKKKKRKHHQESKAKRKRTVKEERVLSHRVFFKECSPCPNPNATLSKEGDET